MGYLIKRIVLPITMEQAWEFFSNPENLGKITPPEMNFRITSPVPEHIYPGLIITYKVSPLLKLPLSWVTEITHSDGQSVFIDEQRSGPYQIWHHEHRFRKVKEGVEMEDVLFYKLPFGFLGKWLDRLYIHHQVEKIFNYREKVLRHMFFVSVPPGMHSYL